MTAIVELEGVTLVANGQRIVDDISLAVESGEVVALAGPSGSGKTSILRMVLGLVAPTRGVVRLRGKEVSRDGRVLVPPEERGLAMVFQDLALWPHLSVLGNVAFALETRGVPKRDRDLRVSVALERVGLAGFDRRAPATLSGGERQRVAIARALVAASDLMLFDEALASLDLAIEEELLALLDGILREQASAALYVSHEPREARRLARRIAVLERGRLVQLGTPSELLAQPRTSFVRAFSGALAGR
ncbi:MAG: ABC transporter ATP-binding protein [Myxococcales bacterium]|nr:ABC transporter ATP-binding protein [Myxococcales bacterium]